MLVVADGAVFLEEKQRLSILGANHCLVKNKVFQSSEQTFDKNFPWYPNILMVLSDIVESLLHICRDVRFQQNMFTCFRNKIICCNVDNAVVWAETMMKRPQSLSNLLFRPRQNCVAVFLENIIHVNFFCFLDFNWQ